jgi:hypothetical protein
MSVRRGEGQITGAYDINVLDALARNQKNNRDKMYEQAMLNTQKYLENRRKAREVFVDAMIQDNYENFRKLLSRGELPDGTQLQYPNGGAYMPCVPSQTLTTYAMKVAETIEAICEEAMEDIYPKEHHNLAVKKVSDISKANDVKGTTPSFPPSYDAAGI